MAKAKQIAKIEANGKKFTIVQRDGNGKPFVLYRHTWGTREDGCGVSERKRIEAYYSDLYSCIRDMALEF